MLARWTIASLLTIVLFCATLWTQNYLGRAHARDASVAGCLRNALDRADNAEGWRAAQTARMAAYVRDGQRTDLDAARKYERIASSLESRTRPTPPGRQAFCSAAYPAPSTLPWRA